MRIFINPGHGGSDSGACGHGLIERDVAFNIGKLVRHYLRAVGHDVMLFQFDGSQRLRRRHFLTNQAIQKQLVDSLPLVDRATALNFARAIARGITDFFT